MELKEVRLFFIEHYKFDHILKCDNQYYLMNVDEPFKLLLWLVPFLEWLLPHKFYLIDEQTAKNLMFSPPKRQHPHALIISFTMMFGSPIAAWLVAHSINLAIAPLSAVIIEIIAALGLRYFWSTRSIVKKYQNNTLVYQGFLFPVIKNNFKAFYEPFVSTILIGFLSFGGVICQVQVTVSLIMVIITIFSWELI